MLNVNAYPYKTHNNPGLLACTEIVSSVLSVNPFLTTLKTHAHYYFQEAMVEDGGGEQSEESTAHFRPV